MAEVEPPPADMESPLVGKPAECAGTTPLLPPDSRPGMRGMEDWFCTGRLRAASEDHRTSWKVFMAEVPGKLEGVKVLMEQWLIEKEQERIRREAEQADMIGAVTRWLEELQLESKEEMVREYIGETGGTADIARLDDDDLKDLMIDLELDNDEKDTFRAAVMELNVDD